MIFGILSKYIGGYLLFSLREKKYLSLSTEVIRFWNRSIIKSCLLVYEYNWILLSFYSNCSLPSQGYVFLHCEIKDCL